MHLAGAIVFLIAGILGCKSDRDTPTSRSRASPTESAIVVEHPLPAGPFTFDRKTSDTTIDNVSVSVTPAAGGLITVTSVGLAEIGIPEIVMRDLAPSQTYAAQELLLEVAAALHQNTPLSANSTIELARAEGSPIKLHLSRVAGPPPQLAIVFPGPRDRLHERQAEVLDRWSTSDVAFTDFKEDSEVLALQSAAQHEVRKLAARWATRAPVNESLTVEVPFDAGDSWEYLDVDIIGANGNTLSGIVAMAPSARLRDDVKLGTKVDVRIADVLDYQWLDARGEIHGGKVTALIESRYGDDGK